ncbi:S-adenosyl methyltransferase [Jatrophihabitans endophyticus]|uniref:S-adenosyl methyltransferase n=1 Tax=Jatrophihabitans endophyticus TaxID=1206085 RepID=A0A1M5RDK8_9ACTN|nr:SAM-dependent methyltransferase [Jatrophihabitans endophyticus]SHH24427.1 S-adenosyl methyltransferase [Jatrophihabitans endophyticus]
MTESPAWVTPDVDTSQPSIARLYDYLLGGTHNLEKDRALGREAIKAAPGIIMLIRESRKFLQRAVRYALDQGVDQFLDLGSGIPTRGSVHETAQSLDPQAKVVYVDRDPTAVAHGQYLLSANPRATSVRGDLLDPDATLAQPGVGALLDLDRPVAMLLLSVLHFFGDDDVLPALAEYRRRLAPGSLLVVATATSEEQDGSATRVQDVYSHEFATFELRSRDRVAALFGDYELAEPGIVFPTQWRPAKPSDVGADPTRYSYLVGVGCKH